MMVEKVTQRGKDAEEEEEVDFEKEFATLRDLYRDMKKGNEEVKKSILQLQKDFGLLEKFEDHEEAVDEDAEATDSGLERGWLTNDDEDEQKDDSDDDDEDEDEDEDGTQLTGISAPSEEDEVESSTLANENSSDQKKRKRDVDDCDDYVAPKKTKDNELRVKDEISSSSSQSSMDSMIPVASKPWRVGSKRPFKTAYDEDTFVFESVSLNVEVCYNCGVKTSLVGDEILCKSCSFWKHLYCISERSYNMSSTNQECFHCMRMTEKAGRVELPMDESGIKVNEAAPIPGQAEDEVPKGSRSDFKHYWNLFEGEMNVKVGDVVFGSEAFDAERVALYFVNYLIKDIEGRPFVYVSHYRQLHEIFRNPKQRFFPNETFPMTFFDGYLPLSSVVAYGCVMSRNDFLLYRPRGIPEENVFVEEFDYDKRCEVKTKIKNLHKICYAKSCYKWNTKAWAVKRFATPLTEVKRCVTIDGNYDPVIKLIKR